MGICTFSSLFSDRSSAERDALLLIVDECVTRSILTIASIEGHNCIVYQKSNFMFADAAPDTDQQLLAEEGQWIFTIEGEKYYLPSSKRYFLLSYFQAVTAPRKMRWSVTRSTNFVQLGF